MTEAEIKTELDAIDTEMQALRSALDVSVAAGEGGGRVDVSGVSDKLRYLREERRYLQRRLWVAQGATPADPKVPGIDVDQATQNNDGNL